MGSIPAILVILFSPHDIFYTTNTLKKKDKRVKKTINFSSLTRSNHNASITTVPYRHILASSKVALLKNNLSLNWVKFRNQKIVAKTKPNLISHANLKFFPLASSVGEPSSNSNRPKRLRLRQSLSRNKEIYKTPRSKINFSSQQSNTVRDLNENRSQAYARWRRQPALHSYHLSLNDLIFTHTLKHGAWYFQNKTVNPHSLRSYIMLHFTTLLVQNFVEDHAALSGMKTLSVSPQLNDRVASICRFFHFNKLNCLTSTNNLKVSAPISSTPSSVSTSYYNSEILLSRIKTLSQAFGLKKSSTKQRIINSVILLSFRYMSYLHFQRFSFLSKGYGRVFTYFLSRYRSIRPAVSLSSRNAILSRIPISYSNRLYRPYLGMATPLRHFVNDNLVEHCSDNHLNYGLFTQLSSSIASTVNTVKNSLVAKEHAPQIRYTTSLGILKPSSPFGTKIQNLQSSRQLFISKSNLIFASPKTNRLLYEHPLLFKYFFWNQSNLGTRVDSVIGPSFVRPFINEVHKYNFSTRLNLYEHSNLWPSQHLCYTVRRHLLKRIHNVKFVPTVTTWYYDTLVRFIEHYTSRRVYLKFNPFIENSLPYADAVRCQMWEIRVHGFQKILGHRIFVNESLRILSLALRFKDPAFLSHWMKTMLYRMSFWKYRLLFRYVKFTMKYLFWAYFPDMGFKGLKFVLRGKISVAGNARTRTLVYTIGETTHSKVNNRVLSEFTTINSFTGVMGFLVSFYF